MKKIILLLLPALFLLSQYGRAQGCMEPAADEGIKVIGFIQPQFEYDFNGEDLNGKNLDESSFYFNRARLGVMGNIPYDFSYYLMTEISPNLNGGRNVSVPLLLDAFISYNRFAPYAKVAVGQFKSPFGLELTTPCHKLHTIFRARVVEELVHPWRDIGLMVSGGTGKLSILGSKTENFFGYNLAVLNGSGLNRWDTNNRKDVVGRLTIHPFEFVTLGASYRFGKQPPQAAGVETDDVRKRFGFDAEFKYKGFLVQGEYVKGTDEGSYTTGGGCGGDAEVVLGSIRRDGYFVQAMYRTRWNIEPVLRFEKFDPNLALSAGDLDFTATDGIQNTILYGVNYFFNEWTRVQINYLYNAEESGKVEIPNDAILVQFQVVF